jgi:hypothetical protein
MAGTNCPYCQNTIRLGDRITRCSDCRSILHEECWNDNKGCTSYGCSSAAGVHLEETYITRQELEKAPAEKHLSLMALSSVALAVIGVFVADFGMYIGGVAFFLGLGAYMSIRKRGSLRGKLLSAIGMMIAVFDVIFWFVKSGLFR